MIRKLVIAGWLCLLPAIQPVVASGIQTLKLTPVANMDRAELHYVKTVSNPQAVLVLCPGFNGSGEGLIRSQVWQDFAKREKLGLVGLSFASPVSTLHDGTNQPRFSLSPLRSCQDPFAPRALPRLLLLRSTLRAAYGRPSCFARLFTTTGLSDSPVTNTRLMDSTLALSRSSRNR